MTAYTDIVDELESVALLTGDKAGVGLFARAAKEIRRLDILVVKLAADVMDAQAQAQS